MMKRAHFVVSALCILSLTLLITACGGGSPSTGGGGASKPSVTTSSVPAGTVGTAYSEVLQASGGTAPYKWSLKSGGLPKGISLSADGTLSGTPSAAGTADSLVFQVTDAVNNSATSGNLNFKVNPEVAPVVKTAALQDGNVGVAYSTTLTATGGTKPYTWSYTGTLPTGLVLDKNTGAITGTPTASGTSSALVFSVTDFYNTVGVSASLSVKIGAVVQVTTTSLPSGTQGTAYTSSLAATGGSGVYTWALKSGTLPTGLSLNSSTGEISGTPTAASIFNGLVFQATDADTATGVSGPLSLQVYNTAGCSSGAESNLGTQSYAFLIKGFEPSAGNLAPVTIVGSFTSDGQGGITAGEEDINRCEWRSICLSNHSRKQFLLTWPGQQWLPCIDHLRRYDQPSFFCEHSEWVQCVYAGTRHARQQQRNWRPWNRNPEASRLVVICHRLDWNVRILVRWYGRSIRKFRHRWIICSW